MHLDARLEHRITGGGDCCVRYVRGRTGQYCVYASNGGEYFESLSNTARDKRLLLLLIFCFQFTSCKSRCSISYISWINNKYPLCSICCLVLFPKRHIKTNLLGICLDSNECCTVQVDYLFLSNSMFACVCVCVDDEIID